MATPETKRDLIDYLDHLTREVSPDTFNRFSTAAIAREQNISRNLASQYLNDFVREGQVVKVGTRPVLYFHRAGFERYFQRPIRKGEYSSFEELLSDLGILQQRNFECAIGYDLSLSPCVTQLKAAMKYPPSGLPVLLVGENGTGKGTLARLSHAYGVDEGVIDQKAEFVRVDCSLYSGDDETFKREFIGEPAGSGLVGRQDVGVLYLKHFERLSRASQTVVVSWLHGLDATHRAGGSPKVCVPRLIISMPPSPDTDLMDRLGHLIPIVVSVPSLRARTEDERADLIMHFLRVEGRRVGATVSISRGALRNLMEADFRDNVDGLRACIKNCCAEAYLDYDDERLIIRNYSLPAGVLGASEAQEDDDKLVSGDKSAGQHYGSDRFLQYFVELDEAYDSFRSGVLSLKEFVSSATGTMNRYQDFLSFGGVTGNARVSAYEKVIGSVVDSVNGSYNIELSRKCAHMLAQSLSVQLWGGLEGTKWRLQASEKFTSMLSVLARSCRTAAVIVEQIEAGVRSSLGIELDAVSRVMLFLEANDAVETSAGRSCLGVIMCHGYSTATSIADAANRILRSRVYEAIDLTYDEEIQDVVVPLGRLLGKYAHCRTVVLLVDTGSLGDVHEHLAGMTDADLYVVSNVSTALALEVGAAILANEEVGGVIESCTELCAPRCRRIPGVRGEDAVLFCSETGTEAGDRVRRLFAGSLPAETSVQLVTADYFELSRSGADAPVFSRYVVRAIVGTADPGIEGVPFVPLDAVLFDGSSEQLDRVFAASLGHEGIEAFHRSLLKNLTLENVIESITILNPESLFIEVDRAIRRLEEKSGMRIGARMTTGLYVHLCCLVERLVTRTPIESYPDEEGFAQRHAEFIQCFRESFSDICRRYRIEVPVSEIAYAHAYIRGLSSTQAADGGDAVEDE